MEDYSEGEYAEEEYEGEYDDEEIDGEIADGAPGLALASAGLQQKGRGACKLMHDIGWSCRAGSPGLQVQAGSPGLQVQACSAHQQGGATLRGAVDGREAEHLRLLNLGRSRRGGGGGGRRGRRRRGSRRRRRRRRGGRRRPAANAFHPRLGLLPALAARQHSRAGRSAGAAGGTAARGGEGLGHVRRLPGEQRARRAGVLPSGPVLRAILWGRAYGPPWRSLLSGPYPAAPAALAHPRSAPFSSPPARALPRPRLLPPPRRTPRPLWRK